MATELLQKVLEAHGGLNRWNSLSTVQATIISGGQMFDMKGTPQTSTPRRMTISTNREWASVRPFGADDQRTDFTVDRIAIEKLDGTVVNERLRPSEHAEGKSVDAPWDALDRAYFNGYALWTYLTAPFHFVMPGFRVEEIESWREDDEVWRGLRVTYPSNIASHSKEQDFYFGPDYLLRRHDYHVQASGGFAAAQYVFDPVPIQGITFPAKRRAYMRDERLLPIRDRLMVSIDLSDFSLS
ncbi:MAG TPA: hypothetical protein VMU48_03005 [Terracidiphilus sp.]|nr:hypothetical protein [Terracidiphilus sp.]